MDMDIELSAAKRLWGVVGQAPGMAGAGEGERGNETGRGIWREDMDERKKERNGEFNPKSLGISISIPIPFLGYLLPLWSKQITLIRNRARAEI